MTALGPDLTVEEIARRAERLKDEACHRCGIPLDASAASDPLVCVDVLLMPDPDRPEAPIEHAIIFCPTCW